MSQPGVLPASSKAHGPPPENGLPVASTAGAVAAELRAVVPDYELLRRIGGGAYGDVWLARSRATGVFRAVKLVWRHKFEDERPFQREFEGIQRFERISREHPSQLALFHIGRNDSQGYFYYVMELADGLERSDGEVERWNNERHSLPSNPINSTHRRAGPAGSHPSTPPLLQDPIAAYSPHTLRADLAHGRLPAAAALQVGLALTEALSHLHQHGLVHRDVKPSNVIFVNGRPKLADIGLVTDACDQCSVVGTEGYLPPEGPGTPQADIFALGKVLYEAVTGLDRRDFPKLPDDLRSWPDVLLVLELNEVLLKASAPLLQQRYGSAEQLLADLVLLKGGASVKRLRVVERRLALISRSGAVLALAALVGLGVLYESNRQRDAATRSLVRLQVEKGTHSLDTGDLFGSLLSFTEALRLDSGSSAREAPHRTRIAAVLSECPKLAGIFAHTNGSINSVAFSPDGRCLVTAGDDHTAQVWELQSGERLFSLPHEGMVFNALFSPDGALIATTTSGNHVYLWDAHDGRPLHRASIPHHARVVGHFPQFSPDGKRLLTLISSKSVCIWDATTGIAVGQLLHHAQAVSFFTFSPGGSRILTLDAEPVARVWDGLTGTAFAQYPHDGRVTCGAFSPDDRVLATGGEDRCVRLWNLESGGRLSPALTFRRPVDSVCFSPEGERLATVCRDRTVEIWDLASRASLVSPLQHELRVFRADFSPDGRWLATAGEGNRVRLWDTDTGQLLAPPFIHNTPRGPALFSPDGHWVLTLRRDLTLQREEVVLVWDLAKMDPKPLSVRPSSSFQQTAYSPDGRFKAVLRGDRIDTIERSTGKPLAQPLVQTVPFRQSYFGPDNSLLVTENLGARGQVWDLATGEPLTTLRRIRYQLAAAVPMLGDLPHEPRPTPDLIALAQVLSGNRVDETSGFQPLDRQAMMEGWELLKRKYPESFSASARQVLAWHKQEAGTCEQAWNWRAAVFHLNFVIAAAQGDAALLARRAFDQQAADWAGRNGSTYRQQRRVIPPRDPATLANLVDLTPNYTLPLRGADSSFSALPSGLQLLAGVLFDLRGVVGSSGTNRASGQPNVIRIGRKCRRLHFLYAAVADAEDETALGSYDVRFVDGRSARMPVVYGRDLRSWQTRLAEPLTARNAELAWIGANPDPQSENVAAFRLFKTTWENPWPELEIESLDFVANERLPAPLLAALTVD